MRIGEPARNHGVSDTDALHAVRNAVRRIAMEENLTMLIGPAPSGAVLEIGVLGIDGDDGRHPRHAAEAEVPSVPGTREMTTVRHTDDEIERAALRFERLADELDPTTVEVNVTDDLQQVAAVSEAVRADEARLREVVQFARAHGRSWNQIALALGVSRQAARQRFTNRTHA